MKAAELNVSRNGRDTTCCLGQIRYCLHSSKLPISVESRPFHCLWSKKLLCQKRGVKREIGRSTLRDRQSSKSQAAGNATKITHKNPQSLDTHPRHPHRATTSLSDRCQLHLHPTPTSQKALHQHRCRRLNRTRRTRC
jgi:hypothetical protein